MIRLSEDNFSPLEKELRKRGLKMPVLPKPRDVSSSSPFMATKRGGPRSNTDDPVTDRVIEIVEDDPQ